MTFLRQRWEEHYASGITPWDTGITPPEVQAFWASDLLQPSGLALDIGCGPGTNVRYLAGLGLTAIGFDIAFQAVSTGQQRLLTLNPQCASHALLIQADVTRLPLSRSEACYILDLGCSHGLPRQVRDAYARSVIDNLRQGGYYHLYAFDYFTRTGAQGEDVDMGMEANEVVERFTPALEVVSIERARADRNPCRWYLLRKTGGG